MLCFPYHNSTLAEAAFHVGLKEKWNNVVQTMNFSKFIFSEQLEFALL